ncbi:MAG: monovalent cation/H(+) antiporter subunit G [Oscillospiraceae bacterium]|nr:monovalent cation/H(+) antiporter subunit G [Oscillospiraceae bacterium]
MENVKIIAGIALIVLGLFVYVTATFGLFRFQYVLNRMHAAALGDTLGILFVLLGLMVLVGFGFHMLRLGLIICFLWLASPVASHLLAKAEFVTFKHIKSECEVVEK